MSKWKWAALLSLQLIISATCQAQQPLANAEADTRKPPEFVWKESLPIRYGDPGIARIGGTEVRALVEFDKKLFAAIGYWMDTETNNLDLPGAQVLRLDGPDSAWQVDLELTDRMPWGIRTYQAISNLETVRFTTDGSGAQLDNPVDLLLAGVWKRDYGLDVFSRATGSAARPWTKIPMPGQDADPRGTQARSFASHRDGVTGVDVVFAGATNAIFTGTYDRTKQKIVWNSVAEWQGDFTGRPGSVGRVSSFAECNGKLYAAVHGEIYERIDGKSPAWKKVFEVDIQLPHVTGIRGLTSIPNPSGPGEVLLASLEDNPSRIYRIDPQVVDDSGQYNGALDLNVSEFLTQALGTKATYAGIAYNNATAYPDPVGHCSRLLIGLEVVTPQAAQTFGKSRFSPNAYYLVRDCGGGYVLREIQDRQIDPKPELVAVRTLAVSPFPSDPPGTVYAGGFDTNKIPVHNTAWLYKGIPSEPAQ
jgi:hypothetical protein